MPVRRRHGRLAAIGRLDYAEALLGGKIGTIVTRGNS